MHQSNHTLMQRLCLDSNNEESRVLVVARVMESWLCLDSNNEESRVERKGLSAFRALCLDSNNEESRVSGRKAMILRSLQSYQSWICSGNSSASISEAGEP